MNPFLMLLRFSFGLLEEAAAPGDGPTGAAVVDPPAAVDPTPATATDPVTPPADASAPTLTDLEEAMNAGLPADDPAAPPDPNAPPAAAPEFQQMLGISEFVKTPEHVQAAIHAAHEVWSVATGKKPASEMLESLRATNPQGFPGVFNDLAAYVERVSGKKLGGEAPATDDPVQQRLNAIEAQFQQQEQQRQEAIQAQQTNSARVVALDTITKLAKGSAFEGSEAYLLARCGEATNIDPAEMVAMLNRGFTKPLETALKAVQKEETERLKRYNENLIKNYRKQKAAVPSPGSGAPQTAKPEAGALAYKPGETAAQYATRIWNSGAI